MSKPTAGNYRIVNRVLSPTDQPLALTSNGQGQYATVTPLSTTNANQVWAIIDYDANTQSVSPASNRDIQIGWGANGTMVLPNGNYVWTIRSNADGATIRDGGNTVYWGLTTATVNETAGIGAGVTPNFGQRWYLQSA